MKAALPVSIAMLVAGCAIERDGFPSLGARAIERRSDAVADAPTPVATPDPALDAQVAGFRTTLARNHAAFDRADGDAARAIAAGARAKVGSDPWLDAQTALATLDAQRAEMLDLVTAIEAAASARATTLAPDYPALDAVSADAQVELDRQVDIVAKRSDSVPAA